MSHKSYDTLSSVTYSDGIRLSRWARENGISIRTAYRWYHNGALPHRARQLPSGAIIVYPPRPPDIATIYARVARRKMTSDLDRQIGVCMGFASSIGLSVTDVVKEVAGVRRPKLEAVLSNRRVSVVLVETKDRLARVGFRLVEAALRADCRRILFADPSEMTLDRDQDLKDMI